MLENQEEDLSNDEESSAVEISEAGTGSIAQQAMMLEIDNWISHVWMVRTFLKHSDEATDDEELAEVHRGLYDFMLALGPSLDSGDAQRYLKIARKKIGKLRAATADFVDLQPEVSGHMNFKMAAKSLSLAVKQIDRLLQESD
jgi:hypothetical protein